METFDFNTYLLIAILLLLLVLTSRVFKITRMVLEKMDYLDRKLIKTQQEAIEVFTNYLKRMHE